MLGWKNGAEGAGEGREEVGEFGDRLGRAALLEGLRGLLGEVWVQLFLLLLLLLLQEEQGAGGSV